MPIENQVQLLRALKGCPLSVLYALAIARPEPANQEWIERSTGYTDKPVSQALALLAELGLARRFPGDGWSLCAAAQSLPGMAAGEREPDPGGELSGHPQAAQGEDALPEAAAGEEGRPGRARQSDPAQKESAGWGGLPAGAAGRPERRRRRPASRNISGRAHASSNRRFFPVSRIEESTTTRLEPPEPGPEIPREEALWGEIVQACDEVGIREPARSRLARSPGVTARAVRWHARECESLGQAIYRIEHDWPIPAGTGEPGDLPCGEDLPGGDLPGLEPRHLETWERALAGCAGRFPRAEYQAWVLSLALRRVDGADWHACTANRFALEALARLEAARVLAEALGEAARVLITVDGNG